jgi:hypothetical protein
MFVNFYKQGLIDVVVLCLCLIFTGKSVGKSPDCEASEPSVELEILIFRNFLETPDRKMRISRTVTKLHTLC